MEQLWTKELGAQVVRVDTGDEAVERVGQDAFDIVLVNRVLAQDGSSGLDVVRDLVDAGTNVPVMLVSDRDDAQAAAVELGAVRGFGKAALGDPATLKLVQQTAGGK